MHSIQRLSIIFLIALVVAAASHEAKAAAKFDLEAITAFADAQVTIERLRKQKTTNWDEVAAQYEICAPMVQWADAKFVQQYDKSIREALSKCAAGEKPKVHQQTLAKGLQHVAVLYIQQELRDVSGGEDSAKRIAAWFEGIRPTFTRRDKDFFNGNPTLEAAAGKAVFELEQGGSLMARRNLDDAIHRTYALSVLYEIMMVEELRADDRASCEVKVKEAEIFYRIISPRVKKNSSASHGVITAMLSADYDAMDAAVMERELSKGLKGITLK